MSTAGEILSSPPDEFHLACLLLSQSGRVYLDGTLAEVDPDDFWDPCWGWMWGAARLIHGRGERVTKRSLLSMRDAAAPHKQVGEASAPLGFVDGLPFNAPVAASLRARLEQVSGEPVYPSRLPASVRSVRELARTRRLVEALDRAKAEAISSGDYSQALSGALEALGKLDGADVPQEVVRFSELADEFDAWQSGRLVTGEVIPSPWPELNKVLSGGFHPGRSFVIAGRLGEGKSVAGLNAAQYAAEQGFSTLVVSAEMSGLELAGRMMASGACVEYGEITRQAMGDYAYAAVTEYATTNRGMPLWVLDRSGLTIEHIAAVARTMRRHHGLDLLVIDYVQLLKPSERSVPRQEQVAHIANAIKELADALKCAVITLAQLNRDNVKGHRRPTAADLRESDAIGQAADTVILLYHPLTPEGDPTGMVDLIVDKNRFGPRGVTVSARWHGHQVRIGDSWAA